MYEGGPSDPSNPNEGSIWNTTCAPGFYWPDGIKVKTMNCTSNGSWSFSENCTSMDLAKLKGIKYFLNWAFEPL